MCSLTPVTKAPSSMLPVPVRRPFPRMLLARILRKKRLTILWRYRRPSPPLFISLWRRLDRRSTLCPTVHTPRSVFRSTGVFVNNEQAASGVTPDDFRAFLVWPNLHLAKKCLPSCPHVTRFLCPCKSSICTLSVDGPLKCVVRRCSRRQLIWASSMAPSEDGSAATGQIVMHSFACFLFYVGPLKKILFVFRTSCMYIRKTILVSTFQRTLTYTLSLDPFGLGSNRGVAYHEAASWYIHGTLALFSHHLSKTLAVWKNHLFINAQAKDDPSLSERVQKRTAIPIYTE
jgi:hypothetical protein